MENFAGLIRNAFEWKRPTYVIVTTLQIAEIIALAWQRLISSSGGYETAEIRGREDLRHAEIYRFADCESA